MTTEEFLNAVKAGDVAKVEAMLKAEPGLANARTAKGVHAAVLAVYYGKKDMSALILRHGPELTVHDAATVGDAARVRALVAEDSGRIDSLSSDGFTPLGLAAFTGREEIVAYLIERGADVNHVAKDKNAFTALTGAIASGNGEVVKRLLEAGANPNHMYEGGVISPLIAAAAEGKADLVRLLIAHGAEVNVQSTDGKTALDWAREKGHDDVVAVLRERGARG